MLLDRCIADPVNGNHSAARTRRGGEREEMKAAFGDPIRNPVNPPIGFAERVGAIPVRSGQQTDIVTCTGVSLSTHKLLPRTGEKTNPG